MTYCFANTRLTRRHFCNKSIAQRVDPRIRHAELQLLPQRLPQAVLYCLKLTDRTAKLFTLSGKLQT